jgi:hypothetical protein
MTYDSNFISKLKRLRQNTDEALVLKALCMKSLHCFVKEFWPVIEGTPFTDGWHIGAMCEHLQALISGEIKRLYINVPPRHTKSTICSVMVPAYRWLLDPSMTFFVIGYGQTPVARDALKMRDIVTSEKFRSISNLQLNENMNAISMFGNMDRGWRYTTSVGGSILGQGGRMMILDDPNGHDSISQEAARLQVENLYFEVLPTRDNDPQNPCRLLVQQRLHKRDLTGLIQEREADRWVGLVLPARYDPRIVSYGTSFKDPRTKPGQLLWPERLSEADVENLFNSMKDKADGQLQQTPVSLSGGQFPKDRWSYYTEIPEKATYSVWGDLTFKGEASNDYCALALVAHHENKHYIVHVTSGSWKFKEQKSELLAFRQKFPFLVRFDLEDAGNAAAIENDLNTLLPVRLIPARKIGSKEHIWASTSSMVEDGRIMLPAPGTTVTLPGGLEFATGFDIRDRVLKGVQAFIDEAAWIPRGDNDDMMDAVMKNVLYHEMNRIIVVTASGHVDPKESLYEEIDRVPSSKGLSPSIGRPSFMSSMADELNLRSIMNGGYFSS